MVLDAVLAAPAVALSDLPLVLLLGVADLEVLVLLEVHLLQVGDVAQELVCVEGRRHLGAPRRLRRVSEQPRQLAVALEQQPLVVVVQDEHRALQRRALLQRVRVVAAQRVHQVVQRQVVLVALLAHAVLADANF